MTGVISWLARPDVLRRVALASVVVNIGIVISGGAVRLTGSGLGCPTWPRCTETSYVTTPEMGIYGAIEFGNRVFTFVVGLVAVLGVVSAMLHKPRNRRVTTLAWLVLLGIPAQAVLGGITVLTDLNPWVVGGHFLLSIAVLAAAYEFWRAARRQTARAAAEPARAIPPVLRGLAAVVTFTSAAVLVAGTVVTGSGPHAGDAGARRTGLSPETVSQIHADLVFLLLGLAVATWFAMRAAGVQPATVRSAWLIAIILAQGAIGFVQYFTNLPEILVAAHMAGACAVWLATLSLLAATQDPRDHDLEVMVGANSRRERHDHADLERASTHRTP